MFLFAGWNQCSHEHGQGRHMTKQKMHTNMCIEMHGTGTRPWTGWWVVPSRQMETDLDTTELHQHNDQSTQSRPKPEGSGRRALCYNKTIETTSRGSESGRWQSSVAVSCAHICGERKAKTPKWHCHTFHLCQDKNMNNWAGEQMGKQRQSDPPSSAHTHTQRNMENRDRQWQAEL